MALHEAEQFFEVSKKDIRLLSVGTTTTLFSFSQSGGTDLGIMQWAGRLAKVMIAAQQASVNDIVRHRLQDQYVRVDYLQAPEQMLHLALDVADSNARVALRAMAETSIQNSLNNKRLQEILSATAPRPKFHYGPQCRVGDG